MGKVKEWWMNQLENPEDEELQEYVENGVTVKYYEADEDFFIDFPDCIINGTVR